MIICQCRNISDKDVHRFLDTKESKTRPREIKNFCARQNGDECHTCACAFACLAKEHNARITVKELGENLPQSDKIDA